MYNGGSPFEFFPIEGTVPEDVSQKFKRKIKQFQPRSTRESDFFGLKSAE